MQHDRRKLLLAAAGASLGGMALMTRAWGGAKRKGKIQDAPPAAAAEDANSPPEDLMFEHAIIERLLLIYQEGARRMRAGEHLEAQIFHDAAQLVRTFVENYHQQRENTQIYPNFGRHAELAGLARLLQGQHDLAHKLTDKILDAATAERFSAGDGRRIVGTACEAYVRMYRPHMAMESTELFQMLYEVVPEQKVNEIAARFQTQENQTFGADGPDKVLGDVNRLEKALHIDAFEIYAPRDA